MVLSLIPESLTLLPDPGPVGFSIMQLEPWSCRSWPALVFGIHARMVALPVVKGLNVFEERGFRRAPRSKPCAMHELRAPKKLSIVARSFTAAR
jgi:hypothetical protein